MLMYDFHYNHMKKKFNCKLLFTDTDSLCYEVKCEDIYEDMKQDLDLYDTSGYPQDHKLYSTKNKKVLGKMKDETSGEPIEEFCGLRPKMYAIKCGGVDKKRAKGVKKVTVKKAITMKNYVDTLFNSTRMKHTMNKICNDKHVLFTSKQNKETLSSYDDKRYIMYDGITSLPYGHHDIMDCSD